jgi:PAS domain S-box-containing protein
VPNDQHMSTITDRRHRPTGIERVLGADDVIVTKTDLKGHITYANEVFCQVSAMPEADLLGKPHNVIRHPEMPRTVFSLLWDTVASGDEIFAYVVNLAGDGAHYWVLAHVTPSYDPAGRLIGYHSNRRKPAPAAVRALQPLYRSLLDEERRHSRATDAAAAGRALLEDHLTSQGADYERFVWDLTNRNGVAG